MGLLDSILGGGVKAAGEGVGAVLSGIGGLAKDIREAITGDISAEKKAELAQKAAEIEAAATQGQLAINLAEAQSGKLFVAGWRPFIGWVCGFALAYHYIVKDLVTWGMALVAPGTQAPPAIQIGDLMILLGGMLGFGYMRMQEKRDGVQGNH